MSLGTSRPCQIIKQMLNLKRFKYWWIVEYLTRLQHRGTPFYTISPLRQFEDSNALAATFITGVVGVNGLYNGGCYNFGGLSLLIYQWNLLSIDNC